jgi:hypothetical protein
MRWPTRPAYQHPRRVFFVDEMPLAGTNKIDKRVLARQIPTEWRSSHESSRRSRPMAGRSARLRGDFPDPKPARAT